MCTIVNTSTLVSAYVLRGPSIGTLHSRERRSALMFLRQSAGCQPPARALLVTPTVESSVCRITEHSVVCLRVVRLFFERIDALETLR